MFALVNPLPRIGDPFQIISPNGKGLNFNNLSGGTISRGQVAAIDMNTTTSGFANLISTGANSSAGKYPVVVAMADVAASANSDCFCPMGMVPALATAALTRGAILQPGTANSTGGNVLIAASTVSGSAPACGVYASNTAADGTNPDYILFSGINRGILAGVATASSIW